MIEAMPECYSAAALCTRNVKEIIHDPAVVKLVDPGRLRCWPEHDVLLIGLVGLLLLIQMASFNPAVVYVWRLAA